MLDVEIVPDSFTRSTVRVKAQRASIYAEATCPFCSTLAIGEVKRTMTTPTDGCRHAQYVGKSSDGDVYIEFQAARDFSSGLPVGYL